MATNTTYSIGLDARASFGGNDYPDFLLLVDGQQVGSGVVNSYNTETFTFSASLASGQPHTVSIVYTNHVLSGEMLDVQDISINGQKISSSDPSETYVSSNGTLTQWGQMYYGGQINFSLPAADFASASGTPSPTPTPTPAPTPSPTPAPTPTPPTTVTLGSGPDTLALFLSEDAWNGDAQFTVSVDNVQIGGTQTVTASQAAGQTQLFNILGAFGSGQHTVTVNFLNDAYSGTATTDRNLYVNSATIDGATIANATLKEVANGPQSFTFGSSPATVTIGSGPETLSLSIAEDAFQGDAQFTISVDGAQQGGVQTTTAIASAGQTQSFNVLGTFGITQHTVTVNFLNDAYGGSASADRNLYVKAASLDGQPISGAALSEMSSGPQSFTFGTPTSVASTPPSSTLAPTPTPTPTPAPTPSPTPAPTPTPTGPAFFVSPGGSDSGDGSASHPYATVQYALSQMESRSVHTLYLQSGTYNIYSTISLGGADNGDSIVAAPGATPVLNAANGGTIFSLSGVQGATISGLTLQNAGYNGAAVVLSNASSNNFTSNSILNSATSAIEIKNASNSDVFSNNTINGVGATGVTGGAFFVHGGSYDTFSNNLIENTAGNGISLEDYGQGATTNVGNTITRNEILNTSNSSASTDDGAIYILDRSDIDLQTTVSMNYINNAGNVNGNAHVEGIYLDDNASGVTVTSNIVSGVQSDATELHAGYNDTFTNNIFDLGNSTRTAALIQQPESDQPATVQAALSNDRYSGNIIISQQGNPGYVYAYFDPQYVNVPIYNNLYYDPNGTLRTASPVNDSGPVFGNPNFVGGAIGSYAIGGGSAASQIGFVNIDTSQIGPH